MSNWNELLRFARAHSSEPTLSVYVATSPLDPNERDSWIVVLKQEVHTIRQRLADAPDADLDEDLNAGLHADLKAFDLSVARLFEELPKEHTMSREQSWGFFCSATGDELMLMLPPSSETSVQWGVGASVVPFLRTAEAEEALVVQMDRETARVTHFNDSAFEEPVVIDVDTFDELGNNDDAQRTKEAAQDKLLHATVKKLTTMAGDKMPILVGGPTESALRVFNALPPLLADRAIVTESLRMGTPDHSLTAIRASLHTLRARHQHERIVQLREAAYGSGKAALGYETTKVAAEHGAIAELIFSESAWRQHPEEIESLVREAIAEGADVEWAEPEAEQDLNGPIDGVAALLRFPIVSAP